MRIYKRVIKDIEWYTNLILISQQIVQYKLSLPVLKISPSLLIKNLFVVVHQKYLRCNIRRRGECTQDSSVCGNILNLCLLF